MTPDVIDEYIALTEEIEKLRLKREGLKLAFDGVGRFEGTTRDVRIGTVRTGRVIQVSLLRKYITNEIIDKCRSTGHSYRTYAVVDKLKPRKPKAVSPKKKT